MLRTLLALIVGSVLSVVLGLVIAWPLGALLDLSFSNAHADEGVLLVATSAVISATSFGAGFVTAWGAGNNEVRNGILSALLCIALGILLTIMLRAIPHILIPLCVVSPIFGALGGYCRKLIRMRRQRSAA
jgi:hypothetical protein